MSANEREPEASRPVAPADYGVPADRDGLLPWSHAAQRLADAHNYWIATTRPDGRPHVTPVWGVWLDDALFFDGSPETRRGRNIAANPAVVAHLESGSDVVIVEGEATELVGAPLALRARLAAAYTEKYEASGYAPTPDVWENGGLYVLTPRKVLAWTSFPTDMTRWRFTAD